MFRVYIFECVDYIIILAFIDLVIILFNSTRLHFFEFSLCSYSDKLYYF